MINTLHALKQTVHAARIFRTRGGGSPPWQRTHSFLPAVALACCLCAAGTGAPAARGEAARVEDERQDFMIVALPDTQFYSASKHGGEPGMFVSQVDWILTNRVASNIVYVIHEGDITDNGGSATQWEVATNALYRLEDPARTGLPRGIPYGVVAGNHDLYRNGAANFTRYFGSSHFKSAPYYRASDRKKNLGHYDLFRAGGMDFVVLCLGFDAGATNTSARVFTWANKVLKENSRRRAIVVAHDIINTKGAFDIRGRAIYDALKDNTNLFLMLCGHYHGEAMRADTWNGNTVHTVVADYQSRTNGGEGWMRSYQFSPSNNVIRVRTFSPWKNRSERDENSEFEIPCPMTAPPQSRKETP